MMQFIISVSRWRSTVQSKGALYALLAERDGLRRTKRGPTSKPTSLAALSACSTASSRRSTRPRPPASSTSCSAWPSSPPSPRPPRRSSRRCARLHGSAPPRSCEYLTPLRPRQHRAVRTERLRHRQRDPLRVGLWSASEARAILDASGFDYAPLPGRPDLRHGHPTKQDLRTHMNDISRPAQEVLRRSRPLRLRGRGGRPAPARDGAARRRASRIDKMGNVIGIRAGDGPTVMIAAHMDEIGAMVSHIDDDGFLQDGPRGRMVRPDHPRPAGHHPHRRRPQAAPASSARGPRTSWTPRTARSSSRSRTCSSTAAPPAPTTPTRMGVEIGSLITIDRELCALGNDFVTGKALDNRAGVVMMVLGAQAPQGQDRSRPPSRPSAPCRKRSASRAPAPAPTASTPDVAIATDVTIPGDNPGVSRSESPVAAGKGPSITIIDAAGRGVISPRPVLRWLRETRRQGLHPLPAGGRQRRQHRRHRHQHHQERHPAPAWSACRRATSTRRWRCCRCATWSRARR